MGAAEKLYYTEVEYLALDEQSEEKYVALSLRKTFISLP